MHILKKGKERIGTISANCLRLFILLFDYYFTKKFFFGKTLFSCSVKVMYRFSLNYVTYLIVFCRFKLVLKVNGTGFFELLNCSGDPNTPPLNNTQIFLACLQPPDKPKLVRYERKLDLVDLACLAGLRAEKYKIEDISMLYCTMN